MENQKKITSYTKNEKDFIGSTSKEFVVTSKEEKRKKTQELITEEIKNKNNVKSKDKSSKEKKRKKKHHSKRFGKIQKQLIDLCGVDFSKKEFVVEDAFKIFQKLKTNTNFLETFELSINLNLDPKKPGERLKG